MQISSVKTLHHHIVTQKNQADMHISRCALHSSEAKPRCAHLARSKLGFVLATPTQLGNQRDCSLLMCDHDRFHIHHYAISKLWFLVSSEIVFGIANTSLCEELISPGCRFGVCFRVGAAFAAPVGMPGLHPFAMDGCEFALSVLETSGSGGVLVADLQYIWLSFSSQMSSAFWFLCQSVIPEMGRCEKSVECRSF